MNIKISILETVKFFPRTPHPFRVINLRSDFTFYARDKGRLINRGEPQSTGLYYSTHGVRSPSAVATVQKVNAGAFCGSAQEVQRE